MAEGVQGVLEDLLPDLTDLLAHQLFSQQEIEAIITARRDFEYRLARRAPQQRHFLKAIQYEMDLEHRRRTRKEEQQVGRPFASDKGIIRRICALFRRMLRRFPGDVQGWKEYIRFCLKAKALKPLNSAVARALQLHPRHEDFWLIAEGVERSAKGDLDSCRSILQTAVKANPDSVKLWGAYFRLELEFLRKIADKGDGTLSKELVEGEIPKIVVQEALKTLPIAAVDEFLRVTEAVPTPTALKHYIAGLRGSRSQ